MRSRNWLSSRSEAVIRIRSTSAGCPCRFSKGILRKRWTATIAFRATSSVSKKARNGNPRPGGVLTLGFVTAGVLAVLIEKRCRLPSIRGFGGQLYQKSLRMPEHNRIAARLRLSGKRRPRFINEINYMHLLICILHVAGRRLFRFAFG